MNTPEKGRKGGECNRTGCTTPNALWYNKHTFAFYCETCAMRINKIAHPHPPICIRMV